MKDEQVSTQTLDEMREYYRVRASEYDDWFYRRGRYDHSPESNAQWFREVNEVFTALDTFALEGDILELAPGTGIWTERLLRKANSITAVDASSEMIAINRARVAAERVSYVQADLFTWQPRQSYDAVFFGFWISHVPTERLDGFLQTIAAAVRPGGKLFFVDGRREPTSTAHDHTLPQEGSQTMIRKLNDGQAFTIVKNFYNPTVLTAQFAQQHCSLNIRETATYFLYGYGTRNQDA